MKEVAETKEVSKQEIAVNIGIKIANTFEFELKNTITGEVKHYESTNIVLNNFLDDIVSRSGFTGAGGSPFYGAHNFLRYMSIGVGTGTLDPTRTSLFSRIGSWDFTVVSTDLMSVPASRVYSITLNESQGNGLLTEVGLSSWAGAGMGDAPGNILRTHSLITDAEGNPIAIPKTNVDILTIRATLYASFEAIDTPNMTIPRVLRSITNVPEDHPNIRPLEYSRMLRAGLGIDAFVCDGIELWGTYNDNRICTNHSEYGPTVFANTTAITTTRDTSERRVRVTASFAAGSANRNMTYLIKAIGLRGVGVIRLPNAVIFPRKTLELNAGVGDGIRTNFNLSFPQCNVGDEEIYVDNVLQPRDSYDFNGKNMTYAQAWRSLDVQYLMDDCGFVDNGNWGHWAFFPQSADGYSGQITTWLGAREADPYVYDFGEPVKVNRIHRTDHGNQFAPSTITLEYSHDLITWTRAATATANVSFDMIEARYWRCWPTHIDPFRGTISLSNIWWAFDELRDGLIFNTPPPDGAIITAKVTSDYPWKDGSCNFGVEVDFYLGRG